MRRSGWWFNRFFRSGTTTPRRTFVVATHHFLMCSAALLSRRAVEFGDLETTPRVIRIGGKPHSAWVVFNRPFITWTAVHLRRGRGGPDLRGFKLRHYQSGPFTGTGF